MNSCFTHFLFPRPRTSCYYTILTFWLHFLLSTFGLNPFWKTTFNTISRINKTLQIARIIWANRIPLLCSSVRNCCALSCLCPLSPAAYCIALRCSSAAAQQSLTRTWPWIIDEGHLPRRVMVLLCTCIVCVCLCVLQEAQRGREDFYCFILMNLYNRIVAVRQDEGIYF